jgi:hypothetical protein
MGLRQPTFLLDDDFDFEGDAPRPRRATQAAPGSDEKIDVLRRRFVRRESLFRDGDAVDWEGVDASLVFDRSWSHWGPSKLKHPPRRQAGRSPADDAGDD